MSRDERVGEGPGPPANLTSLRARLRNHARAIGEIDTRVQRRFAAVVVNELFLTTGLGIDGPPILVKGGTAMDLRRGTAPARLSRDWDAVVRADLDAFLTAARPALEAGWSGLPPTSPAKKSSTSQGLPSTLVASR